MNALFDPDRMRSEARLAFTLVDALHQYGRLSPGEDAEWLAVRQRLGAHRNYESEAEVLFELLGHAAEAGEMTGTWIEPRWAAILERVPYR